MEELSAMLKRFLIERNMKASQLATKTGLSDPMISKILSGKGGASGVTVMLMAKAVGHTQLETTMRYLSMVRGLADVSLLKF